MSDYSSLRAAYAAAGQEHVFTFWDTLSSDEQSSLLSQLREVDPARVNDIYRVSVAAEQQASSSSSSSSPSTTTADSEIAPPPVGSSESPSTSPEAAQKWSATGLKAVADGQVAVILLAGGQGTRLGSSDPKGCYDIGLPSGKSLFQLQAQRICRLQQLASEHNNGKKVAISWYIMTSGPTRKATEAFFAKNAYFGLDSNNVLFFNQGVLPCLTNEGKIFLDAPSRVAVAPDGNGGIYAALRSRTAIGGKSSVLDDMKARGIRHVYAYCVDNCLAKVGDPTFLGYCISKQARCGTKVVRKTNAKESVGVIALKGGKWNVIEYSEISSELAAAKDEQGELLYRAANIANHYYSLAFLESVEKLEKQMAYHIARKKIPHVSLGDPTEGATAGQQIKPTKPNGMKLELFIFDVLPFLSIEEHALLEVERSSEFSPLKNAPGTGSDDPQTSRRDLLALQRKWLVSAGAIVDDDTEIEISPLLSYAGEGLESVNGKKLKTGRSESIDDLLQLVVG